MACTSRTTCGRRCSATAASASCRRPCTRTRRARSSSGSAPAPRLAPSRCSPASRSTSSSSRARSSGARTTSGSRTRDVLTRPNVHLRVDDGRNFLLLSPAEAVRHHHGRRHPAAACRRGQRLLGAVLRTRQTGAERRWDRAAVEWRRHRQRIRADPADVPPGLPGHDAVGRRQPDDRDEAPAHGRPRRLSAQARGSGHPQGARGLQSRQRRQAAGAVRRGARRHLRRSWATGR